ncbi:MAG: DUF6754 domain-containing protein [Candidatus Bathyarchaeia archaeon]
MIAAGKLAEFLVFIVGLVAGLYFLWLGMRGKTFKLRRLAAVEAIPEVVDRAVETGKPIIVGAGELAYLSGMYSTMTIAGMNVLRYTARESFKKGARVIAVSPVNPEALPLMDGIIHEAAVEVGRPEAYRREDIKWYGPTENQLQVGLAGTIGLEGCAAYIMVGAITGMQIADMGAARMADGIIIGGTARYYHNGTWATLADYSLFSDDIYAAGAICSGDPVVMSSVVGGDVVKYILIAVTLILTVIGVAGAPVISWLRI